MSDYGIVNYGQDRFEVLADGRRVAVFDHENDAKIFVSMKKAKVGELVKERDRYRNALGRILSTLDTFRDRGDDEVADLIRDIVREGLESDGN